MNEIRITDTNSANDNRGRAFGLEGNDFIYVLVAFVVALALYLIFAFVLKVGMVMAAFFSAPVLLSVAAWVLLFRHNKPDGYAEDFFDDLINGEGWSLAVRNQPTLPTKDSRA